MIDRLREITGKGNPQDLTKNWVMQVQRLIKMGFHKNLGKNAGEYFDEMPRFQPQPGRFRDRFDIPILVDPRVSLLRQLQFSNITTVYSITDAEITQLSLKEAQKPYIPNIPYQVWVKAGGANRSIDNFASDERGLTLIEGLALLRERPKFFREKSHGVIGYLNGGSGKRISVCSMEETIMADSFWGENLVASIYRAHYAPTELKGEFWIGRSLRKHDSRSKNELVPTVGK